MMHSGQIDFYQHDTVCTNTCRSTKFDVVVDGTGLSPGRPGQRPPSTTAPQGLGAQPGPLQGSLTFQLNFSFYKTQEMDWSDIIKR
jgi:hypothetical protein